MCRSGPLSVEHITELLPNLTGMCIHGFYFMQFFFQFSVLFTHIVSNNIAGQHAAATQQGGSIAIERHLNDLSGRTAASAAAAAAAAQENNNGNRNSRRTNNRNDGENKLSTLDQILLPLFPNEKLLHRFQGGLSYKPCCLINFGCFSRFLCSLTESNPNDPWFCSPVTLVRLFTCCNRPLFTNPSCVVTTHTLFYITTTNYEVGGTSALTIGTYVSSSSTVLCSAFIHRTRVGCSLLLQ